MPLKVVRYAFGAVILIAHFGAILLFLVLGQQRFNDFQELLSQIATLTPLAAVYVTAFVTYVTTFPNGASDEIDPNGNPVTIGLPSTIVQFILILAFSAALISTPIIVFGQSSGGYETASATAGWIDTAFAGYLGLIFKKLFPFS
jgi:ABC-type multidrug transport system permease subunit